jgi:hypothetical protein
MKKSIFTFLIFTFFLVNSTSIFGQNIEMVADPYKGDDGYDYEFDSVKNKTIVWFRPENSLNNYQLCILDQQNNLEKIEKFDSRFREVYKSKDFYYFNANKSGNLKTDSLYKFDVTTNKVLTLTVLPPFCQIQNINNTIFIFDNVAKILYKLDENLKKLTQIKIFSKNENCYLGTIYDGELYFTTFTVEKNANNSYTHNVNLWKINETEKTVINVTNRNFYDNNNINSNNYLMVRNEKSTLFLTIVDENWYWQEPQKKFIKIDNNTGSLKETKDFFVYLKKDSLFSFEKATSKIKFLKNEWYGYSSIFQAGNKIYFNCKNPKSKKLSLWKTDGNLTNLVTDLEKIVDFDYRGEFKNYILFYASSDSLVASTYILDTKTEVLKNTNLPLVEKYSAVAHNEGIYFLRPEPLGGRKNMYFYRNEKEGAIKLCTESNTSHFRSIFPHGNKVIYAAYDFFHSSELYITDTTTANTVLLNNNTFQSRKGIHALRVKNDKLFFFANENDLEKTFFWSSDGTSNGTKKFIDSSFTQKMQFIAEKNGHYYFYDYNSIWAYDEATKILKKAYTGNLFFYNQTDNILFFNKDNSDEVIGFEMISDTIKTVKIFSNSNYIYSTRVVDNKFLLSAKDKKIQSFWKYDEKEGWKNIYEVNTTFSAGAQLIDFEGKFYWFSQDTTIKTLIFDKNLNTPIIDKNTYTYPKANYFIKFGNTYIYQYQGEILSFTKLNDAQSDKIFSFPANFYLERTTVLKNKLYFFFVNNKNRNIKIYESDGTSAGTTSFDLTNFVGKDETRDEDNTNYAYEFLTTDEHIFFNRFSTKYGNEVFITDGKENNTRILADLDERNIIFDNKDFNLTWFKKSLFFFGYNDVFGKALWKISNFPTTSISEKTNENDLILFPNPTQNEFQVQSTEKWNEMNIYNNLGVKLLKIKDFDINKKVDCSDFPDGIYFVTLDFGNKKITKKVIVHHFQ